MVYLLCPAASPTVKTGILLHYLKTTLSVSASKPLQVLCFSDSINQDCRSVFLDTQNRGGENSSEAWMSGPPAEKVVSTGFTLFQRCSWLGWTRSSCLVSSTYSARWSFSVSGGNRAVLFTIQRREDDEASVDCVGCNRKPLHTKA